VAGPIDSVTWVLREAGEVRRRTVGGVRVPVCGGTCGGEGAEGDFPDDEASAPVVGADPEVVLPDCELAGI